MEKIMLNAPDSGEAIELFVLEQTCINGRNYLLATEEEEADSDAYILKEIQTEGEDTVYEFVEDDVELDAISRVFEEMLEDVGIER
ncbi:Protein of uncharacterised function (DUF1292) [uncultured Roseburia sp.]|uniref:DUF1292 domain-containing protein n=1 Tax=Brotonthovivens ammoniilytica TaxID=2981725 RepID=A0ABT2TME0_9FIRM|nr:DUF1292 domain-containing protein [Brotonthovivens ammoniilytica]MCU6763390.1 DUF1292 domain-containing protein [Brotonthovivens ammoniilytica]SCJ17609.1 Protein of uncharacterised function (DUF1292) [uncultured Roseburia sp.]